jgi:hypothetical protein
MNIFWRMQVGDEPIDLTIDCWSDDGCDSFTTTLRNETTGASVDCPLGEYTPVTLLPGQIYDFTLGASVTDFPQFYTHLGASVYFAYYDPVTVLLVPEPASFLLLGLGALVLRRRR